MHARPASWDAHPQALSGRYLLLGAIGLNAVVSFIALSTQFARIWCFLLTAIFFVFFACFLELPTKSVCVLRLCASLLSSSGLAELFQLAGHSSLSTAAKLAQPGDRRAAGGVGERS